MRKLWLTCACCAAGLAFSYSPPPASSRLPSLGISHAAAQVFPGHYRRVARRVYRRGYRRAARYGAYAAGTTAAYSGYPNGYGYGGYGFGGYSIGGYGGYAYPYGTGYYRRAY